MKKARNDFLGEGGGGSDHPEERKLNLSLNSYSMSLCINIVKRNEGILRG